MSRKIFLLTLIVNIIALNGLTQSQHLSPFSRFGLGDLNPSASSGQIAMGTVGTALVNEQIVNMSNPAANIYLEKSLFDFGLKHNRLNLSNANTSQNLVSTGLNHFTYAFPVKNKYCLSAGIIPFSRVGYTLKDQKNLNDSTTVNQVYNGKGGVNRAFMGHALRLINRNDSTVLSLGVNINFLFGTINRESRAFFPSDKNYYNTRDLSYTTVQDLMVDWGVLYRFYPVKNKDIQLSAGLTYSLASSMRAIQERRVESFVVSNITGNEFVVDTILYQYDDKGKLSLPQQWTVGLGLNIVQKWSVNLEFRHQSWSNYSQSLSQSSLQNQLQNSYSVASGIEYTPSRRYTPATSYLQYINYRVGSRFDKQYMVINGEQLKGLGLSAGVSMPLGRASATSKVHFVYEYYRRGNVKNTLLAESNSMMYLGFTFFPSLNERWFYKRKYD